MASDREQLIIELEKLGEPEVRKRFIRGNYGTSETRGQTYATVETWLKAKEAERAEHRADETLKLSRRASKISTIALLISIISAGTAIFVAITR